jgi:hypothetical protein
MIDTIPVWLFIPAFVLSVAGWIAVEYHHAPLITEDHPEAVTGLDQLQRTGVHNG